MGKKTLFEDDEDAIQEAGSIEEEIYSEDSNEEETVEEEGVSEEEVSSKPSKRPTLPIRRFQDESSDSDEAPEEVSVSSSKNKTMEVYEMQKQAALSTKKRKRKQRVEKNISKLDAKTLALLSMNENALSHNNTAVTDSLPEEKRITLTTKSRDLTQTFEKSKDGFKLVSLAQDNRSNLGKSINNSVLDFQKNHFYGKQANRVDAGSFSKHKTALNDQKKGTNVRRRYCVCFNQH